MATIVASASAVSSHSSAQHGEENLFNDSLSFSNNNVLERRRTNTATHSLISPTVVVQSVSVSQRPDRWDPESHIIDEDTGMEDGQF